MQKQVDIMLVDDHHLFLDGVSAMFADTEYRVVGKALNVEEGKLVFDKTNPQIVICDINMPGQCGTDLVRWLKQQKPWVKIIVLSMCDDKSTVSELVSMGINAYLLKSDSGQKLKLAIEKVNAGRFYISEEIAEVLMAKVEGNVARRTLTCREEEIVRLMLEELSNKDISDKLYISERTVEAHRRNIYRKTSTCSIVGLMKWAVENNVFILK